MITNQTTARRLLKYALSEPVVIFTGAGISRRPPSSLPANAGLLTTAAATLSEIIAAQDLRSKDREVLELINIIPNLPLEHFLEILVHISGESALEVMNIFRGGVPNADHLAIAGLWAERRHHLFTLNFDMLLEDALRARTRQPVLSVASLDSFKTATASDSGLNPRVFHLHGMLATSGDAVGIDTTLASIRTHLHRSRARILRSALEGRSVVCLGYGNGDIDTFPLLARHARRVFWYLHDDRVPQGVAFVAAQRDSDFVLLTRLPGETGIAEVLQSVSEPLFWPQIPARATDVITESARLVRFADGVLKSLDATGDRSRACRYVLASIAESRGAFAVAARLLTAHRSHGSLASRCFATNEQLLLGHCYELMGNQLLATQTYRNLPSVEAGASAGVSQLHRASAALGDWKGNPLRFDRLHAWHRTIVSQRQSDHFAVEHRWRYEMADFYQFLGERYLVPSAAIAALRPRSRVRAHALLKFMDACVNRMLAAARAKWLRRAALEYLRLIRRAHHAAQDPAPGFTVLAQLRYLESRAAALAGEVPTGSTTWLDDAECPATPSLAR